MGEIVMQETRTGLKHNSTRFSLHVNKCENSFGVKCSPREMSEWRCGLK